MTTTKQNTNTVDLEKVWWIEFDPSDGKISRVSKRKITPRKKNILESTDKAELCKKLISGITKTSTCAMIEDVTTGEWSLEEKKSTLVIKNIDNRLRRLSSGDPTMCDVNVVFYRKENNLRITLNMENIKKSMNLADIYSVSTQEHTLMNLYLTQKGDPDFLIDVLEVDPQLLFDRHSLLFDVSEALRIHNIEDIDIHTNPLFSRYNLEILDSMQLHGYISNNKNLVKSVLKNSEEHCHINISIKDNAICLESFLDTQTESYRVLSRKTFDILFFNGDVDHYCGMVSVPTNNFLKKNYKQNILLDFDLPDDPLLMFKDLDLVVNYIGEPHE
jgi:hypothetical protein